MTDIKACIFDLDGVIVDTAPYHYKAWRRLANELGFDFTEADNELLKGVSRKRSLEIILKLGGINKNEAEKEVLAARKNDWYVKMISNMNPSEILPGAKEFLQACRTAGLKTALGSASKNTETILNKMDLSDMFDAIIDGNMVSKPKPDPEVFLKGAAVLHTDATQCVVFEDAVAGVEAARNGGMKVVGIGSPVILKEANLVISGLDKMRIDQLNSL